MNIKKPETRKEKTAIIMGAGPAGLTAAYEFVTKTNIKPIIIEAENIVGGISKTIDFKGWRFDIGPHRFFSKSPVIINLWEELLPLQGKLTQEDINLNRIITLSNKVGAPDPEETDRVMLAKNRFTRIYHNHKLFDYPVRLDFKNLKNIDFLIILKIISDYLAVKIKPIKPEKNLEDFFINRFGKKLYQMFFQDYTEKVWGVACQKIPKDWGEQRIKQLSISKILSEVVKNIIQPRRSTQETSLINKFFYPKFGSGQIYEIMAKIIQQKGGIIKTGSRITAIKTTNNSVVEIETNNSQQSEKYIGDYFLSSLPIKNLIGMIDSAPSEIKTIASGLLYRDFILVAVLYKELKIKNETKIKTINNLIPDNWIYIQEKNVKIGRLDIINNFSPWLLKDKNYVWLGAEYFCNEGDALWNMTDEKLIELAQSELSQMGIAEKNDLIDGTVYRQAKAYPAYLGTYDRFKEVKTYLNSINNLYSIGRNGQHRYNNMDHSMLTAIKAVDNIIKGGHEKNEIWEVNAEEEYHEK